VHGFARTERDPDVILSAAGTKAEVEPVRRHLRALYGTSRVGMFPTDIERLGGMTSVQARFLRRAGGAMLHVELSRQLRNRLAVERSALAAFVGAVAEGLSAAYPRSRMKK
jgi:hypothetical protein